MGNRLAWFGAVLGLVVVGLGAGFYVIGLQGETRLERWIGEQVVGVIEAHLTADVSFATLDYQAPLTVVVGQLSLSSHAQPMVDSRRLRLELAEAPRLGQPIRIKSIKLDQPRLYFVQRSTTGEERGGFVAWRDLVKPAVRKDLDSVPRQRRLSEVLDLRHVRIEDGHIEYRAPGYQDPMVLRGIELTLNIPPDEFATGQHRLTLNLQRQALLALQAVARVNLDEGEADVETCRVTVSLNDEGYAVLPPQLQAILRRYQAVGSLVVEARGRVSAGDFSAARADVAVELADARVVVGDARLSLDRFSLQASAAGGKLSGEYAAALMDGDLRGGMEAALTGDRAFSLDWAAEQLDLAELAASMARESSAYAGRLSSQGTVTASLLHWPQSIGGGGTARVTQGRLVALPFVAELVRTVRNVTGVKPGEPRDTAEAEFDIRPDRVTVGKLAIESSVVAARIRGDIYYDARLDLQANAGPLEKVQSILGPVGEAVGRITDKVITYTITGSFAEPKVSIKAPASGL